MGNGFFGTGILLAVLVVAVFIFVRIKIKRVGMKRTCCGGHAKEKRAEKVLESEALYEASVQIEDLCCEDCAIRVENAFNRMEGISAKACHKEKRAVLLLCKELDETEIRRIISDCGFTAGNIQMKAF